MITTYFVHWETCTKNGHQYRRYYREFNANEYGKALALYLSKSRDQFPRLYKCDSEEIRPAYVDENGLYHANFTHDTFTTLRQYGE